MGITKMESKDSVEFYNVDGKPGRDLVASVKSSIVPPVGSKISIRKQTWEVVGVSYSLDHADDFASACLRANVELRPC